MIYFDRFRLGTKGEWIAIVKSLLSQVASDVTHEKIGEISFGETQEQALAEATNGAAIKLAEQTRCHEMRVAKARQIIGSPQSMEQSAQLAAQLLASAMIEDVAKVDEQAGLLCASLMEEFLNTTAKSETTITTETGVDENGDPIFETSTIIPEAWERLGILEPAKQAQLEEFILTTIRSGWSAMAGYNVHYEIPKAINAGS